MSLLSVNRRTVIPLQEEKPILVIIFQTLHTATLMYGTYVCIFQWRCVTNFSHKWASHHISYLLKQGRRCVSWCSLGTICNHLEPFGTIWNHLEPHGIIWNYLEPFRTFWNHLEFFGIILYHWRPFGTISLTLRLFGTLFTIRDHISSFTLLVSHF